MRVIVTGGAGFIGSALVRYLVLERSYEVLVIDKLTYAGSMTSLQSVKGNEKFRFVKADICDSQQMKQIIADFRPERIMHLAAESHVDRSINGAEEFIRTNILGTFILLEAVRQYWEGLPIAQRNAFRFVHVSTDEVYGSLGGEGLFSEITPYDPSSPYSASKASSDHLAKSWYRTYGLPVIITNCSNNYGPYHFPEKLIPLTILNAVEGERIPVYGTGENIRDWLFVEDHARALELVASRGRCGETYNIGGRNERRNIDVVHRICEVLDAALPTRAPHQRLVEFVTDRPGHDARYAIDASKLETELGWKAIESFDSGIERTVHWFVNNEWWWRPLRTRYSGGRLGLQVPAEARSA